MAWVKGQSGNPTGRPGGKKEACQRLFWNDLHNVWKDEGEAALRAMVKSHPNQFCDIMARVLPKDEQRQQIKHSLEVTLKQPEWLKLEQDKPSQGNSLVIEGEVIDRSDDG